jgi:hypothetical protein
LRYSSLICCYENIFWVHKIFLCHFSHWHKRLRIKVCHTRHRRFEDMKTIPWLLSK